MQQLLEVFSKYKYFFLFLLLELVSLGLIFRFNTYQNIFFFNSTNALSASVLNTSSSISSYFGLQSRNTVLSHENALLRKKLAAFIEKEDRLLVNDIQYFLPDSLSTQYLFYPATIINNSLFSTNNYITLDKGEKDGLKEDMGIISSTGIVGKVSYVSANYAIVMSVLNTDNSVSAEVRSKKILGSIEWEGNSFKEAKLKYIPRHLKVEVGDTVITSGYNAIYPADIHIGIISEIYLNEGQSFYDIDIQLSTNFNTVRNVYAVENVLNKEQKELEKQVADE
ncbi:MAG: rod shape-determining protein MreC [Cyclobacteriaceae bacterium]